jgi:lipopolysaccharide heptosyltransferase III
MARSFVDFSKISRVLVIHLRQYGDVLLTSPMFSALKKHAPHIETDALVYNHTAEMLTFHPAIAQVHRLHRRKELSFASRLGAELHLLRELRARRYDILINVGLHPSAVWLNWFLRPRYHVAPQKGGPYDRLWSGNFTHIFNHTPNGRRHQVELNLDALRQFGVFPGEEDRRLVLVPGEQAEASVRNRMAAVGLSPGGFVVVHSPSNWAFKCLPPERTARFIEQLVKDGERVVLTAAPAESDLALVRAIRKTCNVDTIDFSGQLSMKELAALIGQAKLVVAVDSAPCHIAAAMQTPVVAIFGPTNEYRWGPWRTRHRVVRSNTHPCQPCNNAGCGGSGVSDCLLTLPVESIRVAARELLAERAERRRA